MSTSTSNGSLFELDRELDLLLDEIQEQAEEVGEANVSPDLISRFQEFCLAFDNKVDRIGNFLINLNARAEHCRCEVTRLSERARSAENKAARTKQMVLYFLASRGMQKVEGLETTLRRQKNSQDSVVIHDESAVPIVYCEIEAKIPGSFWQQLQARISEDDKQELNICIRRSLPHSSAIKAAKLLNEEVPGTEIKREYHLRVAWPFPYPQMTDLQFHCILFGVPCKSLAHVVFLSDAGTMAANIFRPPLISLWLLLPLCVSEDQLSAQDACRAGVRVEGTAVDPTGAIIPQATVVDESGEKTVTDAAGRFTFVCLPKTFSLRVQAQGFAETTIHQTVSNQRTLHLDVVLSLASVQTDVQVTATDAVALDPDQGPATLTLDTNTVRQLADDPDDLLRQLQVLAAEAGGDPSATQITVDGFQGSTVLPPKGSIASIRINPDLFSAEYQWPPFSGGLVEIVTKPGVSSLHGSLFFTGSDGAWNATTAFAPTSTPASKRRYGFELSGNLIPRRSDFSMSLEKRDIDEFKVVNAQTLTSDYTVTPLRQTVSTPQRLWMGLFRNGWQLTPADTLTGVFTANVNQLGNQGVSALVLPESGYTNYASKYDLHFSNALTVGAGQLHQTRLGFTWWRTQDTPNSSVPSLQVAGYFTSGGATVQSVDDHGFNIEFDHDVMLTKGRSSLKFGTQMQIILTRNYEPNTFNGAWLFASKSAPVLDASNNPTSATTTIDGMEAYRRTLLGLAGGGPTTYQVTIGNPRVPFTQWTQALYAEETLQLAPRLTMAGGLRYQEQTVPSSFANFEPRLGFAWSPDKQSKWVLHARAGIFNDFNWARDMADVLRLDGVRQHLTTVYSPSYSDPLGGASGSIETSTRKVFARHLSQKSTASGYFNVERAFPRHWQARVNFYWGADWNTIRMCNINAPMVATTVGAAPDPTAALLAQRPYGGNENILQYENSGHLAGNVVSMSLDQHSYKRFQFHASYRHANFKADGGDGIVSPQSSYSEAGESSRADWLKYNAGSFFGSVLLPGKLEAAAQFDASGGAAYSITTGTDANGDGILNDRPAYATANTPGVKYQTRYGLMTADTTNGNVPRNVGTMPPTVHLDMNLSRIFVLNPKDKDHQRSLTFNVRSANVLNHTNVNGVGTVVSSPSLDQPYQAEPARRIEAGARFSF